MAQRYGCRPSRIVGIADPRVAFDFDAAVALRALTEADRATRLPESERLRESSPDRYDEEGNCLDFSPIVH